MAKGRGNKIGRTQQGTSGRRVGRNTAPGMTTSYYRNERTGQTYITIGGSRVRVDGSGRLVAPRSNPNSGNRSFWQRVGDFVLGRRR